MIRIFGALLLLLLPWSAIGTEAEFLLRGAVAHKGDGVKNAFVKIYRNTFLISGTQTDDLGQFQAQLDLNHIYLIEVDKEGFYPLKVNISTVLPKNRTKNGVKGDFELNLEMIEALPGLQVEILNNPIAQIRYNPKINQFDYDEEYYNYIRLEVERLYSEAEDLNDRGVKPMTEQDQIRLFKPPHVNITGRLYLDEEGTKPLRNYPVGLFDQESKEQIREVKTDEQGRFHFVNLESDRNYIGIVDREQNIGEAIFLANDKGLILKKLNAAKEKFTFILLPSEVIELSEIFEEDPWLNPIVIAPSGKQTICDIINYETNSWEINEHAIDVLANLLDLLQENPEVTLEIRSHTDCRGDASQNLRLSQRRAEAAKEYLCSKGIAVERIKAVGLGETQPKNYCVDKVECTEYQFRENRRTEFLIVSR